MAKPKLLVYSLQNNSSSFEITSSDDLQSFDIKDIISGAHLEVDRDHIEKLREILWDIKNIHG